MKNNLLIIVSLIFIISANSYSQRIHTPLDQLVYDHCGEPFRNDDFFGVPWGAHEGLLHGVPSSYDWSFGARPGYWFDLGDNQAVSTWGQVYEWEGGSPETGVRIQIRNHMFYAFAHDKWLVLEDGKEHGTQGSHWAEDFTMSYGEVPGRDESSNGGGESFPMTSGRNLHWWIENWPRASIPEGTEAYFITCEIRLIPDGEKDVNLNDARYLAGVSADAYPTDTAYGPGPWPSLSISRHKFITSEWQTFTAYIAGSRPKSVEEYRKEIFNRPLPPFVYKKGPEINIINPLKDTIMINPQNIDFVVEVQDDSSEVNSVTYFNHDTLIGESIMEPFSFSLPDPPVGDYKVQARAFNVDGDSTSSSLINFEVLASQPPLISISNPSNRQVLDENMTIHFQFNTSDNDGQIARVELFINDILVNVSSEKPFDINWDPISPGSYSIYAVAIDNSGTESTSEIINITVGNCKTGTNLLKNGTFGNGTEYWATWKAYGNTMDIISDSVMEDNSYFLKADIISTTGSSEDIRLYTRLNFQEDIPYRLCFQSKAEGEKNIKVLIKEGGIYGDVFWQKDLKILPYISSYGPFVFELDSSIESGELSFYLGEDEKDIWFDDVVVTDEEDHTRVVYESFQNKGMHHFFPNPVAKTGHLKMNFTNMDGVLKIFNSKGVLIFQECNYHSERALSVMDFAKTEGLYFLELICTDRSFVSKIVVK